MSELDYPDTLAIVPACEGHGATHQAEECHEHGWALIDTSEDDGPFLESSYREALEDVVRVARERVAYKKAKAENDERFMLERDEARRRYGVLRDGVLELCHKWDDGDFDPWYWTDATNPLREAVARAEVS